MLLWWILAAECVASIALIVAIVIGWVRHRRRMDRWHAANVAALNNMLREMPAFIRRWER